jgi:cytochrome P450
MLGAVLVAVLVVILTAYVILLATKKQTKLKTLPGPASWPLLGHTLQMSTNSAGRFDRPFVAWAKQYGKMFRLNVFNQDWVVLSEYEDVHEMLVVKGRIFTDRLTTYRSTEISFGSRNIAFGFPSNPQWLPMKKAAYRALHQHGTGLNRIEEVLVPLAQEFISDVKQYNGREVDIYEALYNFVSKVLQVPEMIIKLASALSS